jgi:hypothetical protein
MSAQPSIFPTARVLVSEGVVYVRELDEADSEVVRVVGEADDPALAVSQCLRVGARALRAAHVSVDVDVIERSFAELESRFETRVTAAVDEIARSTTDLLSEDGGALPAALGTFSNELETLLGDTFDPDSKSSVLASIEALVGSTVKQLIASESPDSPMGRLKADLVDTVQREVGDVADEVRRVTEHLGILDATEEANEAYEEAYEATTGKGFDYEDLVDECVGELASAYGDLHESTGKERGSTASQVGDEVVTLNRDDVHGCDARFALEMKNRKLNMRTTMAELEEAMANRDALCAIAVFRSQDQAPTAVPFQYFDDKAIVVLDPDDEDTSALRLAYMWARWMVRRQLVVASEEEAEAIDLERVGCLLDDAARAVERHVQVKRFHTQAKKSIDQAAEHVSSMVGEVGDALVALDAELRS